MRGAIFIVSNNHDQIDFNVNFLFIRLLILLNKLFIKKKTLMNYYFQLWLYKKDYINFNLLIRYININLRIQEQN